jgi:predicted transcriptional regulator
VITKVFWKLLEYAEFNTGKVYMNVNRRKEVMDICSISKTSYYRAIDELVKAGIIEKDGDTYTIDERMFWKGDRKVRDELKDARLKVSLSPIFQED